MRFAASAIRVREKGTGAIWTATAGEKLEITRELDLKNCYRNSAAIKPRDLDYTFAKIK